MSTRICCSTNTCLLGTAEEVHTAVAPAQAKTIGIGSKEGKAAVAVSKMTDVCRHLLRDIFVSRIGGVLQTIIAVLISSLGVIDDIIDCNNGYKVLPRMVAYLPSYTSNWYLFHNGLWIYYNNLWCIIIKYVWIYIRF